ncbi:MAG: isoprenoid biosynthesis glyoxalase ElbB [Candidatus Marinimicrobia bacterium]|nr:isoprenoid biosynthesis glyoxalase ElbB [Candidatus Neomarinimicrobiota bacterium]
MPKVGIVLSGSGYLDGAEIQESVLTMLALDRAGAEMIYMAPDIDQLHVVNHQTGKEVEGASRNVLVESARITRGNVHAIGTINSDDLDALIFPGGFGVAKNLCDYAMVGADCQVDPVIENLAIKMHNAGKPIGVMCIAPAMMARILGNQGLKSDLTIGSDEGTANDINTMGGNHITCSVREIVVDKENKVVSTPAYMEAQCISEAADGIEKLVSEVLALI